MVGYSNVHMYFLSKILTNLPNNGLHLLLPGNNTPGYIQNVVFTAKCFASDVLILISFFPISLVSVHAFCSLSDLKDTYRPINLGFPVYQASPSFSFFPN